SVSRQVARENGDRPEGHALAAGRPPANEVTPAEPGSPASEATRQPRPRGAGRARSRYRPLVRIPARPARGIRKNLKMILASQREVRYHPTCLTDRDRPIHLRLGATTPHSSDGCPSNRSLGP